MRLARGNGALMGRHTAPIPVVTGGVSAPRAIPPITDPRLFDRPLVPAVARSLPPVRAFRRETRAPALFSPETDDDGIDDEVVDVEPLSVRAVRDAEDTAAAEEPSPPRLPRARDVVFGAAALLVASVAVGAALLP